MGCGAARRDVRGGSRHRRRRPGDVGALRFRRVARAGPRRRAPDGRAGPRPASHARAARLGACHPAAPLHAHERGVGDGATPVRHAARGHGFRGVAPAHPRPYCPASASKGAGQERFGRTDEMTRVEKGIVTAVVSAIVATGLAAQQPPVVPQTPLEVTLQEAVRRALDVQPAMVQARGDQRNAGASGRSAWGAFLPTVNASASASHSNSSSFRSGTTDTLPPLGYSYSGGLSASLVLFDGFSRLANLRAASATQDAAAAGFVNQRYQVAAATAQVFFTALANEELVRVAQAQVERAKAELQTAVNKFQAGAATRSDTLTATVDVGNALLALLQTQANLATAQANLGRQVGVDQLVRAVPDSAFPQLPDTTTLRASVLQTAPLIKQAEAQASATGARVWSARSQYWPTLSVSYDN